VEVAEGRFEPREVKLGQRAGDYVEVQSGLGEGEKVVTSANFLIDAESNLKAALAAFGASGSESKANSEISNPKPETRNPQREGR
jgi:Cu(I)/Ag(I) efflux system membrane fusion protein